MRTYRITLGNGKVLGNLELLGDNFVSQTKITDEDFLDGLDGVKIEYTGEDELDEHEYHAVEPGMHDHMKLIYCRQIPRENGYFFVLRDIDEAELKEIKTESCLDYLEMLNDV